MGQLLMAIKLPPFHTFDLSSVKNISKFVSDADLVVIYCTQFSKKKKIIGIFDHLDFRQFKTRNGQRYDSMYKSF